MDAIDHAAAVLRMFDIEPGPLDRLLGSYIAKHSQLNSRQRRLVSRAVYGVARWRRRIEACMRLAGIKVRGGRALAEAYLRWRTCGDFEHLRPALDLAPELDALEIEAVPRGRFPGGDAAYFSYPDFLFEMLVSDYGPEAAGEIAAALNEPIGPTLRANVLLTSRDNLTARLRGEGIAASPTERSPYGLKLSIRSGFRGLASFKQGLFEPQDEASQIVSILAAPRPGERVLDACAGAGGKALAMAMLMQDRGRIVAFDTDRAKLKELARRSARAGIKSIMTVSKRELASVRGGFDLVFIDAPCSGLGTLRRAPDIRWRVSAEQIEQGAVEQRRMLAENAALVAPGGRLIYVTCSLLSQENERVADELLMNRDFSSVDAGSVLATMGVDPKGIVDSRGFLKTDPRAGNWDGFFAAVMRRA